MRMTHVEFPASRGQLYPVEEPPNICGEAGGGVRTFLIPDPYYVTHPSAHFWLPKGSPWALRGSFARTTNAEQIPPFYSGVLGSLCSWTRLGDCDSVRTTQCYTRVCMNIHSLLSRGSSGPRRCVGARILSPDRTSEIRRLGPFRSKLDHPPELLGAGRTATPPTPTPLHVGVTSTPNSPVSLVHAMWKFSDIVK